MQICEALEWARSQGIDNSDRQALLLHCLDQAAHNKAYLRAHDQDRIDALGLTRYEQLISRCKKGEPVAYLIGEKEFYGLTFKVTPATLIPRPDTETLVDWVIECARGSQTKHMVDESRQQASSGRDAKPDLSLDLGLRGSPAGFKILDLGTGSGCIAITLKNQLPSAEVWATDISPDALSVAKENARTNKASIEFRPGSWFEALSNEVTEDLELNSDLDLGSRSGTGTGSSSSFYPGFNLIVSNPPYIAEHDPHLANLQFEPYGALVGGRTGLEVYRELLLNAPNFLSPGGRILFEHGYNQGEAIRALFETMGYESIQSRTDLAGICRCTGGIRPKNGIIGA